jgi:hypothetical protein
MRSLRPLLASSLLLFTWACGGSDPSEEIDSGYSSLSSGAHSEALASFQSALANMTATDGKFLEAKVGELSALCYIDAQKAREGLVSLGMEAGVQPAHFRTLVDELVAAATKLASTSADDAGHTINEAVAILTHGKETFPGYEKWDALINKVGDKAKALGNADALATLKGLGYVGDD